MGACQIALGTSRTLRLHTYGQSSLLMTDDGHQEGKLSIPDTAVPIIHTRYCSTHYLYQMLRHTVLLYPPTALPLVLQGSASRGQAQTWGASCCCMPGVKHVSGRRGEACCGSITLP